MNNNNNNTPKYINYTEARESRKCWYIYCECNRKLPAVGAKRSNGKENKKDSGSRRFHTKCNSAYEMNIHSNMECERYKNRELSIEDKVYNELYKKYQLQFIKPEFREFLPDYYKRKAMAIKMSKKY